MFGLPQQVWIHSSTSSSPWTSRLNASIMNFTCSWSLPKVFAMKWNVGSSVWMHRHPASRSASSSLFIASDMSQITSRLSLYLRSEEHTELQSPCNLVCRLLLEKKKKSYYNGILYHCIPPRARY